MSRVYEQAILKLQRRQNLRLALRFVLFGLMLLLTAWLLFHTVYHFPGLAPPAIHGRVMFLLALSGKALVAMLLVYLAVIAMRRMLSPLQVARLLDMRRGDDADTFQNAVELAPLAGDSPLVSRLLDRADTTATTADVHADNSALRRLLPPLAALALAVGAVWALQPAATEQTWRFLKLRQMPGISHKATVEVEPGDVSLLRGSDLTIRVLAPEADAPHCLFQRRDELWREQPMQGDDILLPGLDASFDYYVATPWATSDTFRIEVFEEPSVRRLALTLDYPPHTGLEREYLPDSDGQIRAIAGASVHLAIEANNALQEARLLFDNGDVLRMERLGQAAFETSFTAESSGGYRVHLRDHLDNESTGVRKAIRVTPDRPPEVRFAWPARDTTLTQNLLTRLLLVASDDFGLSDLTLHWQVNGGDERSTSLLARISGNTLAHDDIFDLRGAGLIPGDRVVYHATIRDNHPPAQLGESRRWVLRFPSIEEIYQQIEEAEERKQEDLAEALERSSELAEEFEEKRRELMKQDETDWQDRDELEKMMQRQEELSENVENMAQEYQELIETLQQNEALSQETLQKMEKIQQLMEEIADDELQRAMEEMRQAMEQSDQDMLRQAMEEMRFNMEEFARKLDQTIDLLENIKKEQALEKARQIAEEMERMQSDLQEKTQNSEMSPEELARRQEAINEKLEALQEQTAAADSLLDSEQDAKLKEMMDELREMMQSDSLRQQLDDALNNLQNNEMQKASQQQQSAAETMLQMLQMLSQMKEMMSSGAMADNQAAILLAAQRLLVYSHRHEQAAARYVGDPYVVAGEMLACWEGIQMTVRELYSVPMIMLSLHPKFPYDQSQTAAAYRTVFTSINDARYNDLQQQMAAVQKGINLMAYDLMQSSSSMNSSGSPGGGMESLMQSMQQMSQQQMTMNALTQQLLQQMMESGGRLSQDARGQLQRLAAEEERLAENLRRLLQNDPDAMQQGSSLQRVADELESIAREMRRGRLTRDLVERQDRILSRLLDSQRSIHQREHSRQRQAETGERIDWENPAELQQRFEEMRRRALLDDGFKAYPRAYQEVIKEYLRRLNEKVGGGDE
ncbi:MAG: hypothetical protein K8R90_09750 [Candidatus Cloacimonetes bacterium]|nr:hypothetical protein [Candidatus Cloacimonadota bacterium]